MTDTELAVVGAGLAGAATAWALARRGVQVVVVDQFEPANPWGASHGRARIFRVAYPDPLYVGLARAALPLWRELERITGVDVLTVTGAVDHGDPAALAALACALDDAGEPHEWLSPAQAAERWPGLAFAGDVLHHPRGGRLDAEAAVHGLLAAARAAGAQLLPRTGVGRIEVRGEDDVRLHHDRGSVRARHVVVASGAWSAGLLDGVPGVVLPQLRVTQEQPALFAPIEAPWPSFIHHEDPFVPGAPDDISVYGLGGPEGVKIGHHGVGREVDPADRVHDVAAVDRAELEALVAYARRWLPGVDPERVVPQPCTYTSSPDGDFVIGRCGAVTIATGFSGHGFKFGPVIGELVAGDVPAGRPRPDPDVVPAALHAAAVARFAPARPRFPEPAG